MRLGTARAAGVKGTPLLAKGDREPLGGRVRGDYARIMTHHDRPPARTPARPALAIFFTPPAHTLFFDVHRCALNKRHAFISASLPKVNTPGAARAMRGCLRPVNCADLPNFASPRSKGETSALALATSSSDSQDRTALTRASQHGHSC